MQKDSAFSLSIRLHYLIIAEKIKRSKNSLGRNIISKRTNSVILAKRPIIKLSCKKKIRVKGSKLAR